MLKKITLNNITALNKVIYCSGIIASDSLGVKSTKGKQKNYPMWKKRLENQVKDLCKDIDRVMELSKGDKLKKEHSDQLQKNTYLDNELKQREESLIDTITE